MKSYIVYIIRSGATKEETEGKYIGHTDVELSEEGRKQLENMRSELVYPPVGAVISSPLKRCIDTAAILYPDNKCITIDSLIECNFGEFEGKDAEELKDYPMFPRWLAGEQGVEPPFGESNEAFAKRVCEGFIKIIDGLDKDRDRPRGDSHTRRRDDGATHEFRSAPAADARVDNPERLRLHSAHNPVAVDARAQAGGRLRVPV